ncbi:hypothetical protein CI088_10255 [Enterococcus plantarum]|uniref:Uncharacterized protein n=1 Tax=Enterococcus plantarum TaxID=1077675 RepID=A0A2W3Z5M2_9ENTE|nr:hypothetical protein CI088_10255 [Enterococcus plantarum]
MIFTFVPHPFCFESPRLAFCKVDDEQYLATGGREATTPGITKRSYSEYPNSNQWKISYKRIAKNRRACDCKERCFIVLIYIVRCPPRKYYF